jgi:hypothetical protein
MGKCISEIEKLTIGLPREQRHKLLMHFIFDNVPWPQMQAEAQAAQLAHKVKKGIITPSEALATVGAAGVADDEQ